VDPIHADGGLALEAPAGIVHAFGRADGSASFAGLRLDHQRQAIIIYRVPSTDFDRAVHRLAGPRMQLILENAAHTHTELQAARDRVWDLPASEDITGLSVPIDGSTVKVTFDGNAAAAQAWMDVALPGLVSVEPAATRSRQATFIPSMVPVSIGTLLGGNT